jgi:hypothetical protein
MSPAQFRTQRVAYWKGLIKDPHLSQIGGVEPPPELGGERRSQGLQQPGSILRPCSAALFELDDMPTDLQQGVPAASL